MEMKNSNDIGRTKHFLFFFSLYNISINKFSFRHNPLPLKIIVLSSVEIGQMCMERIDACVNFLFWPKIGSSEVEFFIYFFFCHYFPLEKNVEFHFFFLYVEPL